MTVALGWQAIEPVAPDQVVGRTRIVQIQGDTGATARELGIFFGD